MTNQDLSTYLPQWRQAEDKFYGAALSAPELYTAGMQLVRGLVNSLAEVNTVEDLLVAYKQFPISRVEEIGEALAITQRDFLDYNLALDAAFYLRHREILEAQAKAEIQAKIAQAQVAEEDWVTLYNTEQERQGVTFFQKLEMHLSDGLGLYSAIELDWEKGRVYVVEPLILDPTTGELLRETRPPDSRQEFTNREEMVTTVAALKKKYSS
jgi:hypothetical protein